MNRLRLFYAFNFSEDTRKKIITLRDELQANSFQGNFTLDSNLHMTLAFLGECDTRKTATAINVLSELDFSPKTVCMDRIGCFRRADGDTWWVGVAENKALAAMHHQLTEDLRRVGFALEKRSYLPHITIGREVVTSTTPRSFEPFYEEIFSLELMKSERREGVLTYTEIHSKESTG